ncbi:unnamed protein product [Plutella xylostella]|uniref:Proteasomal ubiquitin receptor ADRM1 homolog n=19 Tax=Ditrysia TaxID=37567 RepID=A0A8S4G8B7_PLUXY|nr:unnamed protein product [Plutella xylostella]
MSATALFGNTSGLGGSSGGNKHLVEFRAGRMTLKGRMVHPDKRKGLLYVYQGEDSLMHFCWKDRTTGEVEDDLLIFPDDCEFVRVNECTTGRVYVLKFKSFSKKYFFWMQEPKTDKDDDFCRRINEALNNPPTSGGRGSSGSGAQDGELQNLLNNMSQQQLMQLFGGVNQIGGLSSLLGTMGNSGNGGSGRTSGSASRSGSAPRTEPRSETRAATRPRDPAPAATTAAATPAAAAAAPTTTTASATPRGNMQHDNDCTKLTDEVSANPDIINSVCSTDVTDAITHTDTDNYMIKPSSNSIEPASDDALPNIEIGYDVNNAGKSQEEPDSNREALSVQHDNGCTKLTDEVNANPDSINFDCLTDVTDAITHTDTGNSLLKPSNNSIEAAADDALPNIEIGYVNNSRKGQKEPDPNKQAHYMQHDDDCTKLTAEVSGNPHKIIFITQTDVSQYIGSTLTDYSFINPKSNFIDPVYKDAHPNIEICYNVNAAKRQEENTETNISNTAPKACSSMIDYSHNMVLMLPETIINSETERKEILTEDIEYNSVSAEESKIINKKRKRLSGSARRRLCRRKIRKLNLTKEKQESQKPISPSLPYTGNPLDKAVKRPRLDQNTRIDVPRKLVKFDESVLNVETTHSNGTFSPMTISTPDCAANKINAVKNRAGKKRRKGKKPKSSTLLNPCASLAPKIPNIVKSFPIQNSQKPGQISSNSNKSVPKNNKNKNKNSFTQPKVCSLFPITESTAFNNPSKVIVKLEECVSYPKTDTNHVTAMNYTPTYNSESVTFSQVSTPHPDTMEIPHGIGEKRKYIEDIPMSHSSHKKVKLHESVADSQTGTKHATNKQVRKKPVSKSIRKRRRFWIAQGCTFEEANKLSLKPLSMFQNPDHNARLIDESINTEPSQACPPKKGTLNKSNALKVAIIDKNKGLGRKDIHLLSDAITCEIFHNVTANAGTGTGSGQGQIFLSDLQRYFSGLAPPGLGGAEEAGVERELPAALAGADVVGTAAAPPHAERLAPHLPPAPDNAAQDDVRTTLLSPQFAQVNP